MRYTDSLSMLKGTYYIMGIYGHSVNQRRFWQTKGDYLCCLNNLNHPNYPNWPYCPNYCNSQLSSFIMVSHMDYFTCLGQKRYTVASMRRNMTMLLEDPLIPRNEFTDLYLSTKKTIDVDTVKLGQQNTTLSYTNRYKRTIAKVIETTSKAPIP